MNKLFLIGLGLTLILFTLGCESQLGLDDLSTRFDGDLPNAAQVFIETEYQGYEIYSVESDKFCEDTLVYEIELEDGPGPDLDLYFDANWNFIFSEKSITKQALPAEVLMALDAYASYALIEEDLELLSFPDATIKFKVELESNNSEEEIELIINPDGSIYCKDDDSDDDDDDDDDSDDVQMPTSVMEFIANNYAGYKVDEVETEDLCRDQQYYEVELEDGPGPDVELYFSLEWEYLFNLVEIDEDKIPSSILQVIDTTYTGYSIEEDEVYELNYPNGTKKYFIELEKESGSDLEIIFNADGSIDCIDD